MRSGPLALAILLVACSALADEPATTTTGTDYSRQALLHFVANNEITMSPLPEHLPPGRIRWHLGWMEFHALGMDWRVFYLPIAVPLAGTALHDIAKVPNALELTGTPFATAPQLFPDRSASVNREVKRALKFEHQAKVKVEP